MIPVLYVVSCTFSWLFCEKKHRKYQIMLKHYTAFYIITLTAYEITTLQYHFKGKAI